MIDLNVLKAAVMNSRDGITISDPTLPDNPLIFVNSAFERMTGYSLEEIIGKNCRYLQGDDKDQEDQLTIIRETIKKQQTCLVTLRNYRKDGSMFWNELSMSPIFDNQGKLIHYLGIQKDVTRLKIQSKELNETNDLMCAVNESNRDIQFVLDSDGVIVKYNVNDSKDLYLTPDELIGKKMLDLLPIQVSEQFKNAFDEAIETNSLVSFDYMLSMPSGDSTYSAHIISLEDKRIVVTARDITAEKEKELALIQATKATQELNRELISQKGAIDEHAIVSIADVAGRITYVNDKFCAISGYDREELLGHNHKIVKSDEHPDEFFVDLWKTISSGQAWHGEIKNTNKTGSDYWVKTTIVPTLDDKGKPFQYVGIRTEITDRKQAEEKLKLVAHYDALTNLPSRVLLADRLNHAMVQCQRRNNSLAVAFMDLDGFKAVNDLYGHYVGDELLVEVAQRMKEALREGDTLARIGGDEFIAVMVDLENIEDSESVLKRLLKAAAAPVTLGDAVMQISASIGVSFYPQDDADADLLMRHADQAMYFAKQAGKNRYQFFDTTQDNAMKIRQQSIGDVCSALGRREFVLHYQPKVNMRTGDVIGVEALIRWQHPTRGIVPPLDFLPAIEGHAISLELSEWVIDTALIQISQWRSMGLDLSVSVNISAYQLQQGNFTTRITALLEAHPEVDPHYLELEVLESSELSDISQLLNTMSACHELGVCFALDDFGTGYSSLTHIKRLPAYLIKIDQSFVRDMLEDVDDLAIVESVIGLAKTFKREVIAEGVETIEHGAALLRLGCELAQGYGIARPMTAGDIPEWVSNWKTYDSWQTYKG
ncbi:EAL domain-containing protein [Aliiglaciecola sp. NS0011-25]|uniref:sensor domain-containing protein n=1 Tax=Aliiglaciecola sp. NS0011-25 TaxID=3127654 RepID=UPI00310A497B